jgi:hypothetical protein
MNRRTPLTIAIVAAGAATLGYGLRAALAAGIPASGALTYSGLLEDVNGAPLSGSKNIAVELWTAATAGTRVCDAPSRSYTLAGGHFQVPLPDTCATAVKDNPDLWVNVVVDGASVGRSKLGAVPYAIEAGHATTATSANTATNAASAASLGSSAVSSQNAVSGDAYYTESVETVPALSLRVLVHGWPTASV